MLWLIPAICMAQETPPEPPIIPIQTVLQVKTPDYAVLSPKASEQTGTAMMTFLTDFSYADVFPKPVLQSPKAAGEMVSAPMLVLLSPLPPQPPPLLTIVRFPDCPNAWKLICNDTSGPIYLIERAMNVAGPWEHFCDYDPYVTCYPFVANDADPNSRGYFRARLAP